MKLLPYFIQKYETSLLTVYRLTLFLADGGRGLWEIGEETDKSVVQKEYLNENGFYTSSLIQENGIYFARLDPQLTHKQSFYTWEEIQENPEKKREDCFRTYTFCFEQPQEKIWFCSEFCEVPFEGMKETPSALFQGLKNNHYKKV